jgi:hypothetical protein
MSQRKLMVLLTICAILVVALSFAVVRNPRFQKWYNPPTAGLPQANEVAEMRAGLRESHVGFSRISEFVVSEDHVPIILRWLEPAEYVSRPPIRPPDELGEIRIKTKDGRELHLRFYWAGKNPAVFTFDGEDHFWGNDEDEQGHWVGDGGIRLGKAIRRTFEASTQGGSTP